MKETINPKLLNGADLAYVGDAYYELYIREYLIAQGTTKSNELKKKSLKFVSAHAHNYICEKLIKTLTLEEMQIFKRGRNGAPKNHRKNLDPAEYLNSSGLEAVIGYLYLNKELDRLNQIMDRIIKIVEEEQNEY